MQNRIALAVASLGLLASALFGFKIWLKRVRRTSKHHYNTVEFGPRPVVALLSVEVAAKHKMLMYNRENAMIRLTDAISNMLMVRRVGT